MSYNRNKNSFKKKQKSNPKYNITKEGSLGLLALGDIGMDLWRSVRDQKKRI